MASIEQKINAAFTKNQQIILGSFHTNNCNERYGKSRIEARLVYESLLDSGAIEEANFYKAVAEDYLGNIYPPNYTDEW